MAATVIGGAGASLQAEDITAVAEGNEVEVDQSVYAQDEASAKKGRKGVAPEALRGERKYEARSSVEGERIDWQPMPKMEVRSVLAARLSELANAHARVRNEVLDQLKAACNAKSPPRLAMARTDRQILAALADSMATFGETGLTEGERRAVETGCSPTIGMGSLKVTKAGMLLSLADAVGALACEALQADVRNLEMGRVESRPHKSEVQAALEIQALLEGSHNVNSAAKGPAPRDIAALAQINGRLREAHASARTAIRVELNTGMAGEVSSEDAAQYAPSFAVASSLSSLAQSAFSCGSASCRRAETMSELLTGGDGPLSAMMASEMEECRMRRSAAKEAASRVAGEMATAEVDEDRIPGPLVASESSVVLDFLQRALALEALCACALLRERDAGAKEGGGKKAQVNSLGKGTKELREWLDSLLWLRDECGEPSVGEVVSRLDPRNPELQGQMEALRKVIEANAGRRKPKLPKGTRDFMPEQMAIRQKAFNKITEIFKRHGAVELDTPVFELRETLMGKYGEDSKLIYDLADQGGELLSLRFDLTVPFARFLAMHNVTNIKRYHIAKVYRRDNPQVSKGRFREFYQCDFDIAGSYPPMVADSEAIQVFVEILRELEMGSFKVKLNHRQLLDAALEISGAPASKFRTISSSIDKLDKQPWEEVCKELIDDKGLDASIVDSIHTFVTYHGPPKKLLETLKRDDSPFAGNEKAQGVLDETGLLFDYLERMGSLEHVEFDLSMARGLDYYTGVIYEAVLTDSARVGSIGGGGRYDNLVGMFANQHIPAVGASIGIERIFNILEEKERAKAEEQGRKVRSTATQVLVATAPGAAIEDRMDLCRDLWWSGIRAEYTFQLGSKPQKQLSYANDEGIPLAVIVGGKDKESGVIQIKNLVQEEQEEVPREELVPAIRSRLAALGAG